MARVDYFTNQKLAEPEPAASFTETSTALFEEVGSAGLVAKTITAKKRASEKGFDLLPDLTNVPIEKQDALIQQHRTFSENFDWDALGEEIVTGGYTLAEAKALYASRGEGELAFNKELIQLTRANNEVLMNADSLGFKAGIIGAILFDPLNAVPMNALNNANKARKLVNTLRFGAIAGGTAVVEEAMLRSGDPNRTLGESLANVGVITAFGAGVGRLIDHKAMKAMALEEKARDLLKAGDHIVPMGRRVSFDAKVAPAFGFEHIVSWTAPVVRLMMSPSRVIRNVAHRLMETGFKTTDNLEGVASPVALSTILKNDGYFDHNTFLKAMDEEFVRYLHDLEEGAEVGGHLTRRLDDFVRRVEGDPKMSFDDFDELVTQVRSGAKKASEVPDAVNRLAKKLDEIYSDWGVRSKKWWKSDVADDGQKSNYLHRIWHVQNIANDTDRFKEFITNQWLRKQPLSSPDELEKFTEALDETVNRMITSPHERIVIEDIFPITQRGGLKDRFWSFVDDKDLYQTDWVSKSARHNIGQYSRTVINDTLFAEHFGSLNIDEIMKSIRSSTLDEFPDITPKELAGLERELELTKNMIERTRGTYMSPHSPLAGSVQHRAINALLKFNNLRIGGEFVLSSLVDIGRPLVHYSLAEAYGPSIKAFVFRNREAMEAMGMANKELAAFNVGNELYFNQRMNSMFDVTAGAMSQTSAERTLNKMHDNFFLINGLTLWNQMMKRNTGIVAMNSVVDSAAKHAAGKLSKKKLNNLAQLGIGEDDLRIIHQQFQKHGKSRAGVALVDLGKWDKGALGARDRLVKGLQKEIDTIVLTPDVGDVPLILSNGYVKLLAQYKTFALGATTRMTLQGMQDFDIQTATGLLVSVIAGAAVQDYRDWRAGKPANWNDSLSSGIARSGILSSLGEINNFIENTPLGGFAINGVSRDYDWSIYNAGPTASGVVDAKQVVFGGDSRQARKAAERLMPLHNHFLLGLLTGGRKSRPNTSTREVDEYYLGNPRFSPGDGDSFGKDPFDN